MSGDTQPSFYIFTYTDAWSYENTDHLTTFRGRGGIGVSYQSLS